MFAAMLVIALSQVTGNVATVEWNHDYAQALKVASSAGKPLAVFIGSGARGWEGVAGNGELSAEAVKLLRERYVCLYVDSATADGKELADSFEVRASSTLVLSDKSARYQAFKQSGPLANGRLEQVLGQYVSYEVPQSVIRTSYYSNGSAPIYRSSIGGSAGVCRG
jgi:hypothetical protein